MATKRHCFFQDATSPDYRFSADFNIAFDNYVGADTDTIGETNTWGNLCRGVYPGHSGLDIEPERCDCLDETVLRIFRQYQALAADLICQFLRHYDSAAVAADDIRQMPFAPHKTQVSRSCSGRRRHTGNQ
jgi:hypothetical protein